MQTCNDRILSMYTLQGVWRQASHNNLGRACYVARVPNRRSVAVRSLYLNRISKLKLPYKIWYLNAKKFGPQFTAKNGANLWTTQ
jgi:hypothetical protein